MAGKHGGQAGPKPKRAGKVLGKRKAKDAPRKAAPAPVPKPPVKESAEDDDFEFELGDLPAGSGSDSEGPSSAEAAEPPSPPVGELSIGEGDEADAGAAEAAPEEEAPKKKRQKKRKKGPKASALEFEASRALAAEIASSPAADQSDWLWHSYQQHSGASSLERDGLAAECLVELPSEGSLEERLQALDPQWRTLFCGAGGPGGGKAAKGGGRGAGGGGGSGGGAGDGDSGAPTLLLVSPAAMGAIKLMKHCPSFHQACRIAKLFAKHIKVPEQQELLGKAVVRVGAGTPNRITKLADLESLKLHNLKYVVLDASLDAKQRTILDIPETRADWWELFSKHLRPRLAAGQTKLALVNSDKLA